MRDVKGKKRKYYAMLTKLKYYLSIRRYRALAILSFFVFVSLLLLVFTPYHVHDLVQQYRIYLMWLLIALLFAMIGVLIYAVSMLNNKIEQMTLNPESNVQEVDKYNFYDDKGDLKLSVRSDAVYYIEAADNYAIIHYMSSGKMEKLMIRNTLKNIEWRLKGKGLVRCHRSYIVNLKLVHLLRRTEGDIELDFDDAKIPNIPVSKSYAGEVMDLFTTPKQ